MATVAGMLMALAVLAMPVGLRRAEAAGDLHELAHVPVVELATLGLGIPLLAGLAGWVIAIRETAFVARQRLE